MLILLLLTSHDTRVLSLRHSSHLLSHRLSSHMRLNSYLLAHHLLRLLKILASHILLVWNLLWRDAHLATMHLSTILLLLLLGHLLLLLLTLPISITISATYVAHLMRKFVALCSLCLPSSSICKLPFFLLLVKLNAFLHIGFQFSTFSRRKLVQLKFEDFIIIFIDTVAHYINYTSLLVWREVSNRVF